MKIVLLACAAAGAVLLFTTENAPVGLVSAGALRYLQLCAWALLAYPAVYGLVLLIGRIMPEDQALPAPDPAEAHPAAKKKYSERDFMPPGMRAQDGPADPGHRS